MGLYATTEEMENVVLAFEQCTLPSQEWTHAAHLTVALWYLTRHPLEEATSRICGGIQAYNASRGLLSSQSGGYHETVTRFYICVIARYLDESDFSLPLPTVFDGLMREYGHKKLLAQYYSRALLLTPEARTSWVEPDLHPWD